MLTAKVQEAKAQAKRAGGQQDERKDPDECGGSRDHPSLRTRRRSKDKVRASHTPHRCVYATIKSSVLPLTLLLRSALLFNAENFALFMFTLCDDWFIIY